MIKLQLRVAKTPGGYFYLPIPEETAQQILADWGRRIICTPRGKPDLHCALLRSKVLGYYIMLGKKSREKLKIEFNDQLEIIIRQDTTPYQAEVPEELAAVLETDSEGLAKFEALTNGKKRSIIHYINSAKQSTTRINRALKLIERIKLGVTDQRSLFR